MSETVTVSLSSDEPVEFDALGRETQLLALLEIIATAKPPLVVGIHGDWGEGKTSFMRILMRLLDAEKRADYRKAHEGFITRDASAERAQGSPFEVFEDRMHKQLGQTLNVPSVFFNPWEHQFEEEPIFPLLDAIRFQHRGAWSRITSKFKKLVEDPKFRIIGKAALGVAKLAGPGWFSALSQQIGDEARDVMDTFGKFDEAFGASIDSLLDKLDDIAKEKLGGNGLGINKRLVVFIDDLDRCEAEYVVKILEALKLHLMNSKCVYVLGCAPSRVRKCLVGRLGISDEAGAKEYLEKIVQLPVRLPPVREKNLSQLLYRLGFEKYLPEKNRLCFDLLRAFAWNNPRRLKRFLIWYRLQRAMIDLVPGLWEKTTSDWGDDRFREAMLMKIKLLEFKHGEGEAYTRAEDFEDDTKAEASKTGGSPGGLISPELQAFLERAGVRSKEDQS